MLKTTQAKGEFAFLQETKGPGSLIEGLNWNVRVPIKQALKKGNPLKTIPSKIISAIVLSYLGPRPIICRLMQVLNH